ncbi:hypothetical protein ILUMI_06895 [Ignelater luminosus]|uniref:Uncharacterized protein n=1 Tax=Ignelater luminosus TaxID=2038154 RepID=A0A8K0GEW9_IGNLU|nr:hypothetical protein ILUMI_06895 [Ignelater luminosus]
MKAPQERSKRKQKTYPKKEKPLKHSLKNIFCGCYSQRKQSQCEFEANENKDVYSPSLKQNVDNETAKGFFHASTKESCQLIAARNSLEVVKEHLAQAKKEASKSTIETNREILSKDTLPEIISYKDKLQSFKEKQNVEYQIMLHPQEDTGINIKTSLDINQDKKPDDPISESASQKIMKNIVPKQDRRPGDMKVKQRRQTKINRPPIIWKTCSSTDQIDKLLESLLTKQKTQISDRDILEILKKSSTISSYKDKATPKDKSGSITVYKPSKACKKRCRKACQCSENKSRYCHPKEEVSEHDSERITRIEMPQYDCDEDNNFIKQEIKDQTTKTIANLSHLNNPDVPLKVLLLDDSNLTRNIKLSEYYNKEMTKKQIDSKVPRIISETLQSKAEVNDNLPKQTSKEQTVKSEIKHNNRKTHSDVSLGIVLSDDAESSDISNIKMYDNEKIICKEETQPQKGIDKNSLTKCNNLIKHESKEHTLKSPNSYSKVSFASELQPTKEFVKTPSNISIEILIPDVDMLLESITLSDGVIRIEPDDINQKIKEIEDLSTNTSENLQHKENRCNMQHNINEEIRSDDEGEVIKQKWKSLSMKAYPSYVRGRGSSRRTSSKEKHQIDPLFRPERRRKAKRPSTQQKLDKATTWPKDVQVDEGSQTGETRLEKSVGNTEPIDEQRAYIEQINSFLDLLIGSKGSLEENQEYPKDLRISIDTALGNRIAPEGDETDKSEVTFKTEERETASGNRIAAEGVNDDDTDKSDATLQILEEHETASGNRIALESDDDTNKSEVTLQTQKQSFEIVETKEQDEIMSEEPESKSNLDTLAIEFANTRNIGEMLIFEDLNPVKLPQNIWEIDSLLEMLEDNDQSAKDDDLFDCFDLFSASSKEELSGGSESAPKEDEELKDLKMDPILKKPEIEEPVDLNVIYAENRSSFASRMDSLLELLLNDDEKARNNNHFENAATFKKKVDFKELDDYISKAVSNNVDEHLFQRNSPRTSLINNREKDTTKDEASRQPGKTRMRTAETNKAHTEATVRLNPVSDKVEKHSVQKDASKASLIINNREKDPTKDETSKRLRETRLKSVETNQANTEATTRLKPESNKLERHSVQKNASKVSLIINNREKDSTKDETSKQSEETPLKTVETNQANTEATTRVKAESNKVEKHSVQKNASKASLIINNREKDPTKDETSKQSKETRLETVATNQANTKATARLKAETNKVEKHSIQKNASKTSLIINNQEKDLTEDETSKQPRKSRLKTVETHQANTEPTVRLKAESNKVEKHSVLKNASKESLIINNQDKDVTEDKTSRQPAKTQLKTAETLKVSTEATDVKKESKPFVHYKIGSDVTVLKTEKPEKELLTYEEVDTEISTRLETHAETNGIKPKDQRQKEERKLFSDKTHETKPETAKANLEIKPPSKETEPLLHKEIRIEVPVATRKPECQINKANIETKDTTFESKRQNSISNTAITNKESDEEIKLDSYEEQTLEETPKEEADLCLADSHELETLLDCNIRKPLKTKLLLTEVHMSDAVTTVESRKPSLDEIHRRDTETSKPKLETKTTIEKHEDKGSQKEMGVSTDETYKNLKSRNDWMDDLPPIKEQETFTEEVKTETSVIAEELTSVVPLETTNQEDSKYKTPDIPESSRRDSSKDKGKKRRARKSKDEKSNTNTEVAQQLEDSENDVKIKIRAKKLKNKKSNPCIVGITETEDLSKNKSRKRHERTSKKESSTKINDSEYHNGTEPKDLNKDRIRRKSQEEKGNVTDEQTQIRRKLLKAELNQAVLPILKTNTKREKSSTKIYKVEDPKNDRFMTILDEAALSRIKQHKQATTYPNSSLSNNQNSSHGIRSNACSFCKNAGVGTNEKIENKSRSSFWRSFRSDEKRAKRYSLKAFNEHIKLKFQKRNPKLNQCCTKDKGTSAWPYKTSSLPELHYRVGKSFDSFLETLFKADNESEKKKGSTKFHQIFLHNKKVPNRNASNTKKSHSSMRSIRVGTEKSTRQRGSNTSRSCRSVKIATNDKLSDTPKFSKIATKTARKNREKATLVRCVRSVAVGTANESLKERFTMPFEKTKCTTGTFVTQEQVNIPKIKTLLKEDIWNGKNITDALANINLLYVLREENGNINQQKDMKAMPCPDMARKRSRLEKPSFKLKNQADHNFSNDSLQSYRTSCSASGEEINKTLTIEEGRLIKQFKINKEGFTTSRNIVAPKHIPCSNIPMSFDISLLPKQKSLKYNIGNRRTSKISLDIKNANFWQDSNNTLGVYNADEQFVKNDVSQNDRYSCKTNEKLIGFFNIHNTNMPLGSTAEATPHSNTPLESTAEATPYSKESDTFNARNTNPPAFTNGSTITLALKASSFTEELKCNSRQSTKDCIPIKSLTPSAEEILIKKDSYDMTTNTKEELQEIKKEEKHPAECLYVNKDKENLSETNATFRESSSSYEDIDSNDDDLTNSETRTESSKTQTTLSNEKGKEIPIEVTKISGCSPTCGYQKKMCRCKTFQQHQKLCLCRLTKAKHEQAQYPFKDSYLFNNKHTTAKRKDIRNDSLSSCATSSSSKYFSHFKPSKEKKAKKNKQVKNDSFTDSETSSSNNWSSYEDSSEDNSCSKKQHCSPNSTDSEEKSKALQLSPSIMETLLGLVEKNKKGKGSRWKKNKIAAHPNFDLEEVTSLLEFLIDKKKELALLPEGELYTNVYPGEYIEDFDKRYKKGRKHHHHHHHHNKSTRKHKKRKSRPYYKTIDMKVMDVQKSGERKFGLSSIFPSKERAFMKNVSFVEDRREPVMDDLLQGQMTFDTEDNAERRQSMPVSSNDGACYPSEQHTNSVLHTNSIRSNSTTDIDGKSSQNNYLNRDGRTSSFIIIPKSRLSDPKQNTGKKSCCFESTSSLKSKKSKDSVQPKKRFFCLPNRKSQSNRDTSYSETSSKPLLLDSATQTAITASVSKCSRETTDSTSSRIPKKILSQEAVKLYRSNFKNNSVQTSQRDNRRNKCRNTLISDNSSLSGDSSVYLVNNTADLTFDRALKQRNAFPCSDRQTQTSWPYNSRIGLPISLHSLRPRNDLDAEINTSRLKVSFVDLEKGTQTASQPSVKSSNCCVQTDYPKIKSAESQKDTQTLESYLKKDANVCPSADFEVQADLTKANTEKSIQTSFSQKLFSCAPLDSETQKDPTKSRYLSQGEQTSESKDFMKSKQPDTTNWFRRVRKSDWNKEKVNKRKYLCKYTAPVIELKDSLEVQKAESKKKLPVDESAVVIVKQSPKSPKGDSLQSISLKEKLSSGSFAKQIGTHKKESVTSVLNDSFVKCQKGSIKNEPTVISSRQTKSSKSNSPKGGFSSTNQPKAEESKAPLKSSATVEIFKDLPCQKMSSEYFEAEPLSRCRKEKKCKALNKSNRRHLGKTAKKSKIEARYMTAIFPKEKNKIKGSSRGLLLYEIDVGGKNKKLILVPDLDAQTSSVEQSDTSSYQSKTEKQPKNKNLLDLLVRGKKDVPVGISALKEYNDKPLILNENQKLFNFAKSIQTCLQDNNSSCTEDSDIDSTLDYNQLKYLKILKGTPHKEHSESREIIKVPISTCTKMEEDSTSTNTIENQKGNHKIFVMSNLDKNTQIWFYDEASLAEESDVDSYLDIESLKTAKNYMKDDLPKTAKEEVEDVLKRKNKNKLPEKKEHQDHTFLFSGLSDTENRKSTQVAFDPNSSSSSTLSFMINPKNNSLDRERRLNEKPKLIKGYIIKNQESFPKKKSKNEKTTKGIKVPSGIKIRRDGSTLLSLTDLNKDAQILSLNDRKCHLLENSRIQRISQEPLADPKKLIQYKTEPTLGSTNTSQDSTDPEFKYHRARANQNDATSETDNGKIFNIVKSERGTQTSPRKKAFHNALYLTVEEPENLSNHSQQIPNIAQQHDTANQTNKHRELDSKGFKKLKEIGLCRKNEDGTSNNLAESIDCYKNISRQFQYFQNKPQMQNKGQNIKRYLYVTSASRHEKIMTIKDDTSNIENNKVYRLIVPGPKSIQEYKSRLDEPERKQKLPKLFTNVDKTLTILPVCVDTKFDGSLSQLSLNQFLGHGQLKRKNIKKLKVPTSMHQELIGRENETDLKKYKLSRTVRRKVLSKYRSLEKRKHAGKEKKSKKPRQSPRSISSVLLEKTGPKENKVSADCTSKPTQRYQQLQVDQYKCMSLLPKDRLLIQMLKVISRQFEKFRNVRSEPFFKVFKYSSDRITSSSLLLQALSNSSKVLHSSNRSEIILKTSKALLELAASSISTIMGIPSIPLDSFTVRDFEERMRQEYPLLFSHLRPPSNNSLVIQPLSSNYNTQNTSGSREEITHDEQNTVTKNHAFSYFVLVPNRYHDIKVFKLKRLKNSTFSCHLGKGDTMLVHSDDDEDITCIYNTKAQIAKDTEEKKTKKRYQEKYLSKINVSNHTTILEITFEDISIQTVYIEDGECQTILCTRYKKIRDLTLEDKCINTITEKSSTSPRGRIGKIREYEKKPNLSKIDDMKAAEYPIIILPKHVPDRLDLKPRLRKLINIENLKADKILLLQSESLSEERKPSSNATDTNSTLSWGEKYASKRTSSVKKNRDNRKCENNKDKFRTVYKKSYYEQEPPNIEGSTSLDSTSKSSSSWTKTSEGSSDHTESSTKHKPSSKKDFQDHTNLKNYFTNEAYSDTSRNFLLQTSSSRVEPELQSNKKHDKPQQNVHHNDRTKSLHANTTDVIFLKNAKLKDLSKHWNLETISNASSTSSVSTTNTEILNMCHHRIFCHNINRIKQEKVTFQEPPKKPQIWQIYCNKRYSSNQNTTNMQWQNVQMVQHYNTAFSREYAIPEKETFTGNKTLMSRYWEHGKELSSFMHSKQEKPAQLKRLQEYKMIQKSFHLNARQQLPHKKI